MNDLKYWRGKPGCNAATYRQACCALAMENPHKVVVEVGVWAGALSRILATLPNLEELILVDSWEGANKDRQPPFFMAADQARMDQVAVDVKRWAAVTPKVRVMHMRSVAAAAMFDDSSVDFFHTDGDHTTTGVMADIDAWWSKVRLGGILSGDNYEMPTVAEGVDRLLPQRQLAANGRLWWVRR